MKKKCAIFLLSRITRLRLNPALLAYQMAYSSYSLTTITAASSHMHLGPKGLYKCWIVDNIWSMTGGSRGHLLRSIYHVSEVE
jgi:hypothetical protein